MKAIFATTALAALLLGGCMVEPTLHYPAREIPPPLSMGDISRLAKEGVSDPVIVDLIKSRGIDARPSADEIVALKKEGLSDAVLEAVSAAPLRAAQPILAEETPGYPAFYPSYYPYYSPSYYGPYWYGWPSWTWHYPYPYYYPYGGWRPHGSGGSLHRYRP